MSAVYAKTQEINGGYSNKPVPLLSYENTETTSSDKNKLNTNMSIGLPADMTTSMVNGPTTPRALKSQNSSNRICTNSERKQLERRNTQYDKFINESSKKNIDFSVNCTPIKTNQLYNNDQISPFSNTMNTSSSTSDYKFQSFYDTSKCFERTDLTHTSRISLLSDKTDNTSQLMNDSVLMGQYSIIKTLGYGNFASVKLAEHCVTKVQVAIKIVKKADLNEESMCKMRKEIEVLKKIKHPNIVELYQVIENDKKICLVMEYCSGGELFDYLGKVKRFSDNEARKKFRQIVSAVQYLHHNGIVHRDLKAENILLDDKGNIKIADFGFADFYSEGCLMDQFCGSPPYAAPELFQGIKYIGFKVDIWSLGVILFALLVGSYPFHADDLGTLKKRVIAGRYNVPYYVSVSCVQLLRKILILDPLKRATIDNIAESKWLNEGFSKYQPYIEKKEEMFDAKRMMTMLNLGYSQSDISVSVLQKLRNSVYALYTFLGKPTSIINVEEEYKKYSQSSDTQSNQFNKSKDLNLYFNKLKVFCQYKESSV
ncbi:MAP/microtubule affinity-regulating kinase 3 [Strongyloides ratti]|uniref:non-specific serine/threonine protein kinase n=1 Tax=Strongyloides ratti TaxID=34506 RepID=A0A090L981_STRRB|nr:MAP/microtubule affinity-regulating kinase 3 [Strongyloides ratti]CEF64080.1 MAP/microtubule affinity-regulating kinase 3 [Strongyloides ratti]